MNNFKKNFQDISKDLMNLEHFPIIRMDITKGFVFACSQAAQEFEEQRTRFFNENEMRDDYMEVSDLSRLLSDFLSRLLSVFRLKFLFE